MISWIKEVVSGFLRNNCSMHAAGLTYFSMLAMVPIVCLVLFAAKTAHLDDLARQKINERIDAMISNVEHGGKSVEENPKTDEKDQVVDEQRLRHKIATEEFAREAREITNQIFSRINDFDIKTLGWVGFGCLLWTIISSLGMVESSFNLIWGLKKDRPIWKRMFLYLIMSVSLPVLTALAFSVPILNVAKRIIELTMGASVLTKWLSATLIWFLELEILRITLTLLLSSVVFAFIYWMMPYCRVKCSHAWKGGLLTAIIFYGWIRLCAYAQIGIARSSAMYGSFAFFPIVLAWLYVGWQIILLGANMVHAFEKNGIIYDNKRF